jgi:hypothetical protein
LGEPERREEPCGQSEGGALSEGAHLPARSAADSAQRLGVQALRGKPHPASDLESLDMHAGMDEPELLMQLLAVIAEQSAVRGRHQEWAVVAEHAKACVRALEILNETPSRR